MWIADILYEIRTPSPFCAPPLSPQKDLKINQLLYFLTLYRTEVQKDDQTLELKIFVKQLMTHSNFIWFALMNLIQVS